MTRKSFSGESWISSATHYKGFDQFASATFHLGANRSRRWGSGSTAYMPMTRLAVPLGWKASTPTTPSSSDIAPTRCSCCRPWLHWKTVRTASAYQGMGGKGQPLTVGGYFSFQGIDGKARWLHAGRGRAAVTCLL
jgi:uncharacterized membrane protein